MPSFLLASLLLLAVSGATSPSSSFTKQQRTVLPWLPSIGKIGGCGGAADPPCDVDVLAAACLNSSISSSLALVPCTYSPILLNTWLSGCAAPPISQSLSNMMAPNCINFPTLAAAFTACNADINCNGITSQKGGVAPWELRAGLIPQHSPTGESTYAITNAPKCHSSVIGCNAFNTNGTLYHCPGGSCDCDRGAGVCARGRDIFSEDPAIGFGSSTTDLYVISARPPPAEWAAAVKAGTMLYGAPESPVCYLPEVGNGYLATVPGWGSMHIGGLFNGACGTTTKARFPSSVSISILNAVVIGGGLDTVAAVYSRRWLLSSDNVTQIEVRTWAHRTRKHVLITDITLVAGGSDNVLLNLTTLWDPESQSNNVPGNDCAGGFSVDFVFLPPVGNAPTVVSGATLLASDEGLYPNVTVALDATPPVLSLSTNAPRVRFITAIAASIDFDGGVAPAANVAGLASQEYAAATQLSWDDLWSEHIAAWAILNDAGIDILPASNDAGDIARAADIESHARSSQYFLFSSLRDDHFIGISPGGLASQNYQGAVFMDADWWMEPPLYFLAPSLAASILQYRFISIPVMRKLATLFGFDAFGGAMAAWTSAYEGNAFGCCSGRGGCYEDCLEHHISGDIAFSAWQYYAATGDLEWLTNVGFPLLASLADYHLARVTPTPPSLAKDVRDTIFHVNGVLPIDEWSVGSGCGSETPGVDDDSQMNGVVKASLTLAAAAARILGNVTTRSLLWDAVGTNVIILYNVTHNHHDQFNSKTCPDGWGGTHYSAAHTVCPSDVEHLTYPLGDVLNTSAADSRADAELFFPLTCRENAGMTTPMHTVVWLSLGEDVKAAGEFNRSMHAACYGAFNVRNEVDKHADITGGHFDNTHFLTGDGGFLQALINGYGGLRIVIDGLRLLQPTLPDSVGTLTLRHVAWRGGKFTFIITQDMQVLNAIEGPSTTLCLIDAAGAREPLTVGGAPLSLPRSTFEYPALLINEAC
jgi:trehalose/maltose hydrolase-like predicted phosphorylase